MARPIIVCKECGEERPHHAKGLCKRCHTRGWRKANPEKRREHARRSRKARQEEIAEYNCQWCEAHPDYHRGYREAHWEEQVEQARQWAKANPDKVREKARRRRALKNGATIGPVDEAAIYEQGGHMCLYCGATEDLTIDHIVALDNGGPHCEDNLLVACGRCNSSKGTKPLEDWLQTQPKALVWVM